MKKLNTIALVGLSLALLLMTVCVPAGCSVEPSPDSDPASQAETADPVPFGNTMANICSGGSAASDGEWVYYLHEPMQKEGGRPALWKIRPDGTQAQLLTEDPPAQLNVLNGWIYYTVEDDIVSPVYKMRTDGTEKQVLNEEAYPERGMIVIGDTIYYIDGNYGISCMKTDGTQRRTLLEGQFSAMCAADGWIYYVAMTPETDKYSTIGKMRMDGTEQQTLTEGPDTAPDILLANDGWLYFINSDDRATIYKLRTGDGSQLSRVGGIHSTQVQIHDGWIYWIQYDNYTLHRMRLDGTDLQNFPVQQCHNPCIIGDWIYFYCGSYPNKIPYRIRLDGSDKQPLS